MEEKKGGNQKRRFMIVIAGVLVVALVIFIVWWTRRNTEKTDDAQVDGNVHPVCARVSGYVKEVLVDDNQAVKENDVVVVLDTRTYDASLEQMEADLEAAKAASAAAENEVGLLEKTIGAAIEQARAAVASAEAQLDSSEAQREAAAANERRAKDELDRTRPLAEKDLASQYRLDTLQSGWDAARATLQAAEANVVAARSRLKEAEARLVEARSRLVQVDRAVKLADSAKARVGVAQAKLDKARLDKKYTTIVAPADGQVTKKFAETGQYVQPGQTLMLVVPLDDTWVTANFKETQLTRMKPGQPAEITVDAYPGVTFKGTVGSISAGTGARFSLLPPENATGNYVKIVQRIPVKILLSREDGGHVLRPGMNVVVTVRVAR
jgi:membrane fusion protein (multidrug efflux system)